MVREAFTAGLTWLYILSLWPKSYPHVSFNLTLRKSRYFLAIGYVMACAS